MRTGSSASAARNAALSAMLRMLPPATCRRASWAKSKPVGRRLRAGKTRRQISPALRGIGKRKLHDEAQAAQERRVEGAFHIGREDRQAAVGFHALQQVADFDVGVAVVAVFDFAALAEQRVGFVEEQDRAAFFGGVEHPAQILFGFADVFADHLAQGRCDRDRA